MISVDQEDYEILKDIFKKYPLTIYAYGSRTKKKHKKFSDLDLCIFDDSYQRLDIFNLKEDLEESYLPFTVDVVPWSLMTQDFRNLIKADLTLIQANPKFLRFEKNLLSKFSYLPEKLGFKIIEQPNFRLIDSGFNSSMFNILYQKNVSDLAFKDIISSYHSQAFSWWFSSNAWTNSLAQLFAENGFHKESEEYCMVLELNGPPIFDLSDDITIKNVTNLDDLKNFSSIIEQYDNQACNAYLNEKIIATEFISKNPLFVAYINQKPVATGSIHFSDDNNAGIYDILTSEEHRMKGVATYMMKYLINESNKKGVREIGLSTSSDSGYRIYEKSGFKLVGQIECYEWKV